MLHPAKQSTLFAAALCLAPTMEAVPWLGKALQPWNRAPWDGDKQSKAVQQGQPKTWL